MGVSLRVAFFGAYKFILGGELNYGIRKWQSSKQRRQFMLI